MTVSRLLTLILLTSAAGLAHGEACVVHSHDGRIEVKLCQSNISIPEELFRSGFCQPEMPGQTVEVTFVEACPEGAFGVCRNAQVSNLPIGRTSTTTAWRAMRATCSRRARRRAGALGGGRPVIRAPVPRGTRPGLAVNERCRRRPGSR